MKSVEFCYWLQGFFEIGGKKTALSVEQVQIIKNHLNLVFKHEIDPSYGGDQKELQEIHDGKEAGKSLGAPEFDDMIPLREVPGVLDDCTPDCSHHKVYRC